jgi:hypothetical protein
LRFICGAKVCGPEASGVALETVGGLTLAAVTLIIGLGGFDFHKRECYNNSRSQSQTYPIVVKYLAQIAAIYYRNTVVTLCFILEANYRIDNAKPAKQKRKPCQRLQETMKH